MVPWLSVRAVPRGVRGSGVPVRSSADTVEGFGEVIDQCPETPLVPSTSRRIKWTEFQSSDLKWVDRRMEYEGRRLDGVRVRERERFGVQSYRSTECYNRRPSVSFLFSHL